MECTCTTKQLGEASNAALRIIRKKNSLPVLSCFLLKVTENELTITATNLETGVELKIAAESTSKGIIAVSADVFTRVIQAQRSAKVSLSVDGGSLVISSPAGKSSIQTVPHDDFPTLPHDGGQQEYAVPSTALISGIESVAYSVSTSLIRPELASIYFHYDQDRQVLVCVATDSFRLAEKRIKFDGSFEFKDALVPSQNALDLLATVPKTGDVHVGFEEMQMQVSAPGYYFISRIIEGSFPAYQAVIPATFVAEAVMLKEDLALALKKNVIFSNESQQVTVVIAPGRKEFTISSRNQTVGETVDRLDAALSGEEIQINFNLRYLSECLSHIASDSVSLSFGGPGKPLVIKGVSDPSYLYLVMPLNR